MMLVVSIAQQSGPSILCLLCGYNAVDAGKFELQLQLPSCRICIERADQYLQLIPRDTMRLLQEPD